MKNITKEKVIELIHQYLKNDIRYNVVMREEKITIDRYRPKKAKEPFTNAQKEWIVGAITENNKIIFKEMDKRITENNKILLKEVDKRIDTKLNYVFSTFAKLNNLK